MVLHVSRNRDEDKTPVGLWMRDTRVLLELTVPEIAHRSGYSESALRKVEGGSNREPSRALIDAVMRVFREVGAEKGRAVSEPPGYGSERPSDVAALVATVRELIEELRDERAARAQWERDFLDAWQEIAIGPTPRDAPAPAPRDAVPQ